MKSLRISTSFILITITLLLINYYGISYYSNPKITSNINDLPAYNCALILGAGKNQTFAPENFAFTGRMKATINLYKSHEALNKIIVSGYSNNSNYDESREMRNYLLKNGVIDSILIVDNEGTRTFKSILNFKLNYGDKETIIISQKVHLQRALFIACALDIKAAGFIAKEIPHGTSIKLQAREVFARLKCTFEIIKYKLR